MNADKLAINWQNLAPVQLQPLRDLDDTKYFCTSFSFSIFVKPACVNAALQA